MKLQETALDLVMGLNARECLRHVEACWGWTCLKYPKVILWVTSLWDSPTKIYTKTVHILADPPYGLPETSVEHITLWLIPECLPLVKTNDSFYMHLHAASTTFCVSNPSKKMKLLQVNSSYWVHPGSRSNQCWPHNLLLCPPKSLLVQYFPEPDTCVHDLAAGSGMLAQMACA